MAWPDDLVPQAIEFARQAHALQTRKGPNAPPYFVHLASVATRLTDAGYDDPLVIAAAYLHDVLEDQPAWSARLRATFPSEVVHVVELLSETTEDADGRPRSKHDRVQGYLAQLSVDDPWIAPARAISCADKIDNARSLLESERRHVHLLQYLNTRPGQHAVHLAALRPLYVESVRPTLLTRFDEAVRDLTDYVARWVPSWAVSLAVGTLGAEMAPDGRPAVDVFVDTLAAVRDPTERMVLALRTAQRNPWWTRARLADEGFPEHVLDQL